MIDESQAAELWAAPDPARAASLRRDPHGRLILSIAGEAPRAVVPVRAFPLSAAAEGISLVGADGSEACWIERLSALDPRARGMIEEELASRDCTPVILRIASVSSRATPSHWDVETDRGPTRLTLKAEEDIRRLPDGALLIADAYGLSFLIPQAARLDKASRRLLDHFL